MTQPHDPIHASPTSLPPDLVSLSAALDDLARHEQLAVPPGLADRVYFRTASMLRGDQPAHSHRFALSSVMRLAAVIAVAAVGVVGVSQLTRPATTTATLANDETFTDMLPEPEDAWSPIGSNLLADMQSELAAFESGLDSFWSLDTDWVSEESL